MDISKNEKLVKLFNGKTEVNTKDMLEKLPKVIQDKNNFGRFLCIEHSINGDFRISYKGESGTLYKTENPDIDEALCEMILHLIEKGYIK